MKVIKITAIWCSACLVMNKVWNSILEKKNIETISLDLDMDEDEANKFSPGEVLPVFIFMKDNKEIKRVVGEHTEEELLKIIEEIGD